MTKEERNTSPFFGDAHLNEMGIALYTEFLLEKNADLAIEILDHVEDCSQCRQKVMESYTIQKSFQDCQSGKVAGKSNVRKNVFRKPISFSAAAILIIGVLSAWYFWNRPSPQADYMALYETYFSPYPDINSQRGSHRSDSLLNLAFSYYGKGEYKKSGQLFTKLPDTLFSLPETQFYYGINLMLLQDFDQAKTIFIDLSNSPNIFNCQAKWNLSLIYLRQNETEKSLQLLKKIALNDACNQQSAEELFQLISGR
jgi:tetratricopeptide (TPR) repeat protein